MNNLNYNPDVLSCLANLSNDEVFTPPNLVNAMLDLLPPELWSNPNAKFLDPVSKSGVFLREMAKRLMKGLETNMPDKQERINHIFKNQLFGIAITELTALLSRRSVYCSKKANHEKYSLCTEFEDEQGNIQYRLMQHTWQNGKCIYCGANQKEYDREAGLETYAYNFIHTDNPEKIFNMKFDVIIGNPPYQLSDGGAGASAIPLYHKFVEQAKKLNPKYLTMIIPSRWFASGKGLDEFRKEMLKNNNIKLIHDFINATDCFPGVEIKGGVCYFLIDKDYKGETEVTTHLSESILSKMKRPLLEKGMDVFVRYNDSISILRKVLSKNENSFYNIVSPGKPFGLRGFFNDFKQNNFEGAVKIYANKKIGFVEKSKILNNLDWIDRYKIFVPKAWGIGNISKDWIKPILVEPNTCCTETYLVFGPFDNINTANNVMSYTQTKFFHLMVSLKKITQDAWQKAYTYVPIQNFNESWTDEKLYAKYGLTEVEITFIESMIRPMNLSTNESDDD